MRAKCKEAVVRLEDQLKLLVPILGIRRGRPGRSIRAALKCRDTVEWPQALSMETISSAFRVLHCIG